MSMEKEISDKEINSDFSIESQMLKIVMKKVIIYQIT